MSYNTRNTRQGQGAGRGTAQIMYHQQQQQQQQPSRPGGAQARLQTNLPLASSFVQQSPQGYAGQQQSTPAYSTQTTQIKASPLTPAQTKVYEYQNQPPIQQQQQQQQQSTPQVLPKTETPVENVDEEGDANMDAGGEFVKKPWMKKKAPGFKVNRKIKRRRQNARLRKILQPKNAIMVLNELKSGVKFTFHEQSTALTQTSFLVHAEVDGKSHTGQGLSKPLAKQNAAENALKALLLEKMTVAAAAAAIKAEGGETMETDGTQQPAAANANGEDIDDLKDEDDSKPGAPEDEVPWGSLASFALYKLFTDWQNQGTHVPIAKQPSATAAASSAPPKTAPMKQLPENPTDRHPVMLLSQMRPGVKFTEKSREGTSPNLTFTLEVTVEGVSYEGVARNKKDAKKEAAKAALAGCLGITYD